MKNTNATDALNEAIDLLEEKKVQELEAIKEHFRLTYEGLKPANLLQSALNGEQVVPTVKNDLLGNLIGLAVGYAAKKVFVGASHNAMRKMFGTILQITVTNIVAKNSSKIIEVGQTILQRISNYRREKKELN
jgi:hypothetical protein